MLARRFIARRLPVRAARLRPFSSSRPRWTPPHVEYPPTPTKAASYATPLLPLPTPPTQPTSHGLFLLYVPSAPSQWPSHIEMDDKLVDDVGKAMALNGIRFVVAHDPSTGKGYHGKLVVPDGLVATFPAFTHDTLSSAELKRLVAAVRAGQAQPTPLGTEILVCTHGARDCRCSDIGGDLVGALRREIARRGGAECRVTECAHVGGHKWAANAILLPSLTFLSNLRPTHAPLLVDHLQHPQDPTLKSELWRAHFRGLIGRDGDAQLAAYEGVIRQSGEGTEVRREGWRLPVRFGTADGETHDVFGYVGESLMEIAKREELGAVEGTCGGHLECATCHMYIPYHLIDDPATRVADLDDAEEDMLDYALGFREEQSRLGCRVVLSEGLSAWSMQGRGVELPEY